MRLVINELTKELIELLKDESICGLIIGQEIGDYLIIENIIPLDINFINNNYEKLYKLYKNQLLGLFSLNFDINLNENFLGDYYLTTRDNKINLKRIEFLDNKIQLTNI